MLYSVRVYLEDRYDREISLEQSAQIANLSSLQKGHLGAHYCVGPLLARLQLREAVIRTAKRFPDLQLEPGAMVPEIPHHGLRAPLTLPVLLK